MKIRQEKGVRAVNDLSKCIEDLTGQKTPIECSEALAAAVNLLDGRKSAGLGLSQLNELLLQLGYDRVSPTLFMYLCDGTIDYETGRSITSLAQLRLGVDRFRRLALLFYGNVKFGFKRLAQSEEDLADLHAGSAPKTKEPYKRRHPRILELQPISGEETFYLGYVVQRNLEQRLKDDPNDGLAKTMLQRREEIVKAGRFNHDVYLCSDHMDVYVATSMREKHEYAMVYEWTKAIFASGELKALNVRWFDPTQAYCADRIDKGLAEALMLKRAQCTLYFAQESDTLGKDSELASTLAQGKPVIAYVPEGGVEYVNQLVGVLKRLNPGEGEQDLLLEQLRVFEPTAAWKDDEVRSWLSNPSEASVKKLLARLGSATKNHYDSRAKVLRDVHPLGIQVHLDTGVANGVLVVRKLKDCRELVRRVLLNELEFDIQRKEVEEREYSLLVESVSGCVFRVMTGDVKLTNSFWNFYLS